MDIEEFKNMLENGEFPSIDDFEDLIDFVCDEL
jgi:hypothetical protein